MSLNLVQHFFNPRELRLLGLGQFQSHFDEREVHGDEQLSRLVVDRVREALDFILERFVQLTQGLHRILESAVCHLIRIFTQGRAVLVFKTRARPRLASNRDLHGLIPVNRETRTSASSVPLRYCSRILPAALCGFSREERVAEKSLRTPSVAKKSVSPCAIGST